MPGALPRVWTQSVRLLQIRRRAPTMGAWGVLFWWTFIPWMIRIVHTVMYRSRFQGASNVPTTGPVIYVANHQSNLDPPTMGSLIYDRPFTSLARSTLFSPWIWGQVLRQMGSVPLDQQRGGGAALRAGLNVLKRGGSVIIFPEGTRCTDGTIGPFKPGMLVLVRRSGAPIVPIYAVAARRWEARSWDRMQIPWPWSRVRVRYGPPVEVPKDLDDADCEQLRTDLELQMKSEYARLDADLTRRSPA